MTSTFTPSGAHAPMACPKCAGEMRAYERSGVIVDQCRDCRGIFLDRGELEHLVDLEADPSDRRDPRVGRHDRRDDRLGHDDRRDPRRGSSDRERHGSSIGELSDLGELGGLGDLGDLLGRRDRSRSAVDPRTSSIDAPKKRSTFFKDLLEGFGE